MSTKVPDLPVKEIIQYLFELDISIKQADILKPTYQFVTSLYESILNIYTSQQIFGNIMSDINQAEQEDTLFLITLYKRMYNFMTKIGVEDFSLKDFTPESKRLIGILSNVINYSMYRDSKKHVYEKMYRLSEENEVIKREIEVKIKNKEKELRKCTGEFEIQNNERNNLLEEINQLENSFKEVVKIQKTLMVESDKLKTERDSANDKLNSLQLLIMNIKQDIACLNSQVVEDPSKLIALLKEMKELVSKEAESLKELETLRLQYIEVTESLKVHNEEIKQLLCLSRAIKECDKSIESYKKDIEDRGSEISNTESSINVCKIRLNHLERQISHIESKLSNLQELDRRCTEEISIKMKSLKEEYEKLSKQRSIMQSKIDINYKHTKSIEQEIVNTRNNHENEVNDLHNILCSFKDKHSQYLNNLKKYFEEIVKSPLYKSKKMKAYRNGNKIVFKYDDSSLKVIERILKTLKDIVRGFENRNNPNFPVNDIKNLINLCNSLAEEIENKNIPKEYVEFVNSCKESIVYFKEIEEKFTKKEEILKEKKTMFKNFKSEIETYCDILNN